jgi:hypothetical protein
VKRHDPGQGYPFLTHLGLLGDLDEVAALRHVEQEFGIGIYPTATEHCVTAGDLFDVVRAALPPSASDDVTIWERFCRALCHETGDRPDLVRRGTLLITPQSPRSGWLRRLIGR